MSLKTKVKSWLRHRKRNLKYFFLYSYPFNFQVGKYTFSFTWLTFRSISIGSLKISWGYENEAEDYLSRWNDLENTEYKLSRLGRIFKRD